MNMDSAVVAMQPPRRKRRIRKSKKTEPPVKNWWMRAVSWFSLRMRASAPRRLRLCETVALGEKRFVAVIEFEKRRFLIGGASNSVSLLTELQDRRFATGLAEKIAAEAR